MTRILVTGGGGFVGRHVVAALRARGAVVLAPSRAELDLLSPVAPAAVMAFGAQTLVHLAWETSHGAFWTAPANLDWTAATLLCARAFLRSGGTRIVGVGTCFEYALDASGPLREQDAPAPGTLYGVAKDATRRVLEACCRETGAKFAWARLFHLYGPDEHPHRLVASIALALLGGGEASCSSGRAIRDFLHAADAGDAIAALAESPVQGAVNIASGRAASVAEVARLVGVAAGAPTRVRLGALPDRIGDPATIVADVARSRRELGWTPRFGLEDGIADAVAWWRATRSRERAA